MMAELEHDWLPIAALTRKWTATDFQKKKSLDHWEQDFQQAYNAMEQAAKHYILEWAEWLEANPPDRTWIDPDSGKGKSSKLKVEQIAEYIYRQLSLETKPGGPRTGWGYLIDKELVYEALPDKYKVASY